MTDLLENLEDEWKDVGAFFLKNIPDSFIVKDLVVNQNKKKASPNEPSYWLEAILIYKPNGFREAVKLNALKIKRDLEKGHHFSM